MAEDARRQAEAGARGRKRVTPEALARRAEMAATSAAVSDWSTATHSGLSRVRADQGVRGQRRPTAENVPRRI